ncbi:sensor histidine kinase [Kitasatospora sp. CB02891]|uniref:sensor histidine kinase n=1 Tax=Kitasatospora sp. CB02891 TaxID=2020329 RepID=UPI000C27EE4C|nr:sensor histidine kinase [Kitasatospora sp. CB02891]PJN26238.1 sensor histidine kinase [Kitasatospora sp. CB02891]
MGGRRLRVPPAVVDAVLAVVLAAVTVGCSWEAYQAQYRHEDWRPFDGWAVALCLLVTLPLAVRRRWPWTVLLVSAAGLLVFLAAGYQPSVNPWAPLLAGYSVIVRRPTRSAAGAAAVVAGLWLAAGFQARVSVEVSLAQSLIGTGAIRLFATGTRNAERNAQLAELTERLRREQELRARHAVVEERLRIARELHDVVAHHLSALAVQAGLAGYVFDSDPPAARAALDSIGATGREALEEMRSLLQVLRVAPDAGAEEEGPYLPTPGLDRLDDLVDRARAAGLDVRVAVTGRPRPLAPGVDLCAFRVVQEALTNVIKHAGPAAGVTVALRYAADRLDAEVADDGAGGRPAAQLPGGGLGLIGMRERVKLYGGSVEAGPRPHGGFAVVFSLPVPAADA